MVSSRRKHGCCFVDLAGPGRTTNWPGIPIRRRVSYTAGRDVKLTVSNSTFWMGGRWRWTMSSWPQLFGWEGDGDGRCPPGLNFLDGSARLGRQPLTTVFIFFWLRNQSFIILKGKKESMHVSLCKMQNTHTTFFVIVTSQSISISCCHLYSIHIFVLCLAYPHTNKTHGLLVKFQSPKTFKNLNNPRY
jgi:hypothetical protein